MGDYLLLSDLPRVDCDEDCGALTDESLQILSDKTNHKWALLLEHGKKARIHWEFHKWEGGCAHGC